MNETDVVEKYPTNFEAWIQEFSEWQTRIGFDPSWLGDYRFDIKFDWDTAGSEIEFGDFSGMPKWERVGGLKRELRHVLLKQCEILPPKCCEANRFHRSCAAHGASRTDGGEYKLCGAPSVRRSMLHGSA